MPENMAEKTKIIFGIILTTSEDKEKIIDFRGFHININERRAVVNLKKNVMDYY